MSRSLLREVVLGRLMHKEISRHCIGKRWYERTVGLGKMPAYLNGGKESEGRN